MYKQACREVWVCPNGERLTLTRGRAEHDRASDLQKNRVDVPYLCQHCQTPSVLRIRDQLLEWHWEDADQDGVETPVFAPSEDVETSGCGTQILKETARDEMVRELIAWALVEAEQRGTGLHILAEEVKTIAQRMRAQGFDLHTATSLGRPPHDLKAGREVLRQIAFALSEEAEVAEAVQGWIRKTDPCAAAAPAPRPNRPLFSRFKADRS